MSCMSAFLSASWLGPAFVSCICACARYALLRLLRWCWHSDNSKQPLVGNAQLLEEEMKTLLEREKALNEELLTLRRDNQRLVIH